MANLAPEQLTQREEAVLDALSEGMSDAEIGDELFVSRETINSHLRHIYRKLGARNRTHAVALAYHHGLLIPKT